MREKYSQNYTRCGVKKSYVTARRLSSTKRTDSTTATTREDDEEHPRENSSAT